MSIVDIAISDFDVDNIKAKEPAHMALKSLCNEGELVRIISKFLNRLHTRLVESNGQFEQQANIISIVKLSSIIGNGLLEINERSSDADALSAALMQWGV
jgi:fumarylacetoacetate (FAA) hydrolase family protein